MEQGTQNGAQPIALPERTREALIELMRQREALDRQINNIVATAQDCLGVPEGWQMYDLNIGFVPPAQPDEATGVTVAEIED